MHYKTITLELLRQYPALHQQLQSSGTLLQTLEHYAALLKARHLTWMDTLASQRPGRDPSQISSEALEMALQDLRDALPADSTPNADGGGAAVSRRGDDLSAPSHAERLLAARAGASPHTSPIQESLFPSPCARRRTPSGQRRGRCQSAARTPRQSRPGCG